MFIICNYSRRFIEFVCNINYFATKRAHTHTRTHTHAHTHTHARTRKQKTGNKVV